MRPFRLWPVILTLFTCVLVVACGAQIAPTTPDPIAVTDCRTVSHALGETEICGTPETIVVLGGHSLDLLLSLEKQPAGVDSVWPVAGGARLEQPEVQIPYLGEFVTTQPINMGSRGAPSLEVLTQIQPDLIVGEAGPNRTTYDLLSQIAPTLLWDVRTQLGQWQQNIRALALALGDEAKAEEAIAQYTQSITAARKDLEPIITQAPTVLLLASDRLNSGNLFAITPRSYLGELMTNVGFELVAPPSDINHAPLSLEVLPEYDKVDHIFVLGYDADVAEAMKSGASTDDILELQTVGIQQDWQENAIAQSLEASQTDQVYFATYIKWNSLNGPIGTKLILDDLRQFLLDE